VIYLLHSYAGVCHISPPPKDFEPFRRKLGLEYKKSRLLVVLGKPHFTLIKKKLTQGTFPL